MELPLKLALVAFLPLIFLVVYFGVQTLYLFPPRTVPTTWFDRAVPFDPRWVWAYQSIYLLMPIIPWMARSPAELKTYTQGLIYLCVPCWLVYIVAPVEGPVQSQASGHWGYDLLISYIGTRNSIPSLHAGLSVYSFVYGWWLFGRSLARPTRLLYCGIAVGWTSLILFSTIATRMHWALDLLPGALLGWLACMLAIRTSGRHTSSVLTDSSQLPTYSEAL